MGKSVEDGEKGKEREKRKNKQGKLVGVGGSCFFIIYDDEVKGNEV